MNFFFGFKNEKFSSTLTIPRFNNMGDQDLNLSVFSALPKNNEWEITKLKLNFDDNFYFLNNENIDNNKIYFLSNKDEVNSSIHKLRKKLININNFTETSPVSFRSNLKIELLGGGFSSYQSDYPYSMTLRKGNILSPLLNLLNKNADENYILFRNIYFLPIQEKTKICILDITTGEVLEEVYLKSNFSNLIKISKNLLKKNIYIFSEEYLGIPIYISIKEKHISLEHTHPPHHYILSEDKFNTINKFKKRIKQIIKN